MSQQPEDKKNGFDAKNALKIGTPECAVFMALTAMLVAVLILLAGFWGTVLLVAFIALGAFIGGVKDKKKAIADLINRLFPARQVSMGKTGDEAIEKLVREKIKEKDQDSADNQ